MAEFTSNDTILSRLQMAPSWDAHSGSGSGSSGSSSRSGDTLRNGGSSFYGLGHGKGGAGSAGPSAVPVWRRLVSYPARLLHGGRPKRLLLLGLTAALLTYIYVHPGILSRGGATLPSVASMMDCRKYNDDLNQNKVDEADLRVILDDRVQRLSWATVTDTPEVAVDGTIVREKGTLPVAAHAPPPHADSINTQICVAFPETVGVGGGYATRLTHIPSKIWQIFLDFDQRSLSHNYVMSWLVRSPAYAYTVLDAAGALGLVGKLVSMAELGRHRVVVYGGEGQEDGGDKPVASSLEWARDAMLQYARFPRRVLRADFLRYLVLALEGGVYADIDTQLVRAVHDWVPDPQHRALVKLVVGLEADQSPPVARTTYEVQFCQWTMASAADHPALWTMLQRILAKARVLEAGQAGQAGQTEQAEQVGQDKDYADLTDNDILELTGPAAWTEVVFQHLNAVAGTGVGAERITWQTLTGMREPRLYGDTLVLPINGFATGVPHSGASSATTKYTMIRHSFQGNWRQG